MYMYVLEFAMRVSVFLSICIQHSECWTWWNEAQHSGYQLARQLEEKDIMAHVHRSGNLQSLPNSFKSVAVDI